MKNTCKILALVLVLMTVLMSVSALVASAAAGQTWTVAGVKALCGTDWDTNNKNNDMTYDAETDSYVKVYTNVKAGSYQFKCAKDHKWDVAYPGSNYNLKVEKDGSTVTIILKGTTVTVNVVAPDCDHAYEVTAATVTCLTGGSRTWTCSKCQDSYTENLDALGHYYDESGKCIRCDATAEFVRVYVENAAKWANVYCYTWDTNPYVAWPGEQMKLDSESGLYYYDIPKHFVNVIFNNGDSIQSADLKTPTGAATIYDNAKKTWNAPHVHAHKAVVTDPTCEAAGYTTYTCSCGNTYKGDEVAALGHDFVEGVCSRCEAVDPDYVPEPVEGVYVFEAKDLEAAAAGAFTDGQEIKAGTNDYFTLIMSAKTKIDSSSKEWEDGYTSGQRVNFGGKTAWSSGSAVVSKQGIAITTSKAASVKIWWVCGGDGDRYISIWDSTGAEIDATTIAAKDDIRLDTLEIPAAGLYYIACPVNNNYIFKIEVTEKDVETPHVNSLVVGETNKIVVSGNFVNQYNLPIEWVVFVAEEDGFYSFIGDNGALAFIFNADGSALISATGVANLEAGAYLICLGNGVVGEFNVAVTKAAWVNALAADTTSKIYVDGTILNDYQLPIAWVPFTVTEKANYAFTCAETGAMALIFDASSNYYGAAADLEAGDYLICVGGGVVGYFNVTVTKTAIGGGDVTPPTHDGEQEFVLGENNVIIDGCTINASNNAVEMVKFVVTEKARYTVTSDKLNTYISTSTNPSDVSSYVCGFTGSAILEPGTYYICCGNAGILGEFTVTVSMEQLDENCEHVWAPANCAAPKTCSKCGETEGELDPEVHVTFFDTCTKCGKDVPTFVVGVNHVTYVKGVTLNDHYFKVTIPEPGTYVISGGAPVKVYMWSIPTHQLENGQLTMETPYAFNVDAMTETGFADSFEITVQEAGVYWIAFNFDFISEETHEFDIEISFKEPLPEPETDPEPQPEVEEVELNFFQKIIAWFKNLIEKILAIFKKR